MARGDQQGSVGELQGQSDFSPELIRSTTCLRCGGLMVPEVFPELGFRWSEVAAERCVQCGETVDSVILKNRLRCPSSMESEQGVHPWHV